MAPCYLAKAIQSRKSIEPTLPLSRSAKLLRRKLRAAPASHGLKDLDTPCQATYPDVKPRCAEPAAHYYWDEWHPTTTIHGLAAEGMVEALKGDR